MPRVYTLFGDDVPCPVHGCKSKADRYIRFLDGDYEVVCKDHAFMLEFLDGEFRTKDEFTVYQVMTT